MMKAVEENRNRTKKEKASSSGVYSYLVQVCAPAAVQGADGRVIA